MTGRATIVTATHDLGHDASGSDPYWWQDAATAAFGKTRWLLELDVQVADGSPYRVSGRFEMPNRLHKVRKVLDGPLRLQPGVVLPVVVDGADPQNVEIDWKAFKATGGVEQLYPAEPGLGKALTGFVAELHSGHRSPPSPGPRRPATRRWRALTTRPSWRRR